MAGIDRRSLSEFTYRGRVTRSKIERPASLIPESGVRATAAVALLASAILAVLAMRYADTTAAGALDGSLAGRVHAFTAGHRHALNTVMHFGEPTSVIVMAGVLALTCLALRRRLLAVLAVLGPAVTGLLTSALKPLVGRTFHGDLSMPSGHTGGITAIALVVALIVANVVDPRLRGRVLSLMLLGAVAVAVTMGIALIALSIHYPTDVLGGFCTAVAAVGGVSLLLQWWEARSRRSSQT
ncbi:phosphatase PAP2 family protein [Pseudonocardia sp. K10HN5]|uniref:Phosphatase PAP2 family protein n=1 Tax=Pseudonocardia acidicola TaxID=2724939 RepID=A0ABX1SIU0_9PSEU|nr:phosphatase PAP2 family protein [Pseudonocardia acidicola]